MKTVFLPIFSGIEGKNIFRGGIYDALRARSARTVFFVGNHTRADYYRRECADPDTVFEVIKKAPRAPLDRFFALTKHYTLRSHTIDLKRRTNYERSRSRVRFAASWIANRVLGARSVRRVLRFLDERLARDSAVVSFFDTYHPDLVFLADLFNDTEVSMAREARRRGIPVVGFLSSWDRLTSRWGIRILPDELLVFNELLRDEAIEYADMDPARVDVVGAVQLDYHLRKPPRPREGLFRDLGLDPATRLIVYGPLGRSFDQSKDSDAAMIRFLAEAIEAHALGDGPAALLVRFPPNDFVDVSTLPQYPQVVYDSPGVRFASIRGQDWDMSPDDLDRLRDLLAHAAVVVCYYSSLSVDAAVFDTPVVNINFYPADERKRHPYYDTVHYRKVKREGGIALVESHAQLLDAIRGYLEHPERDREGRARVVATQAWKLDGHAADRIADKLVSLMR